VPLQKRAREFGIGGAAGSRFLSFSLCVLFFVCFQTRSCQFGIGGAQLANFFIFLFMLFFLFANTLLSA